MARRRYLVTYDVADDKRRTRIMNTLRDHGDRLQFSVFRCDLSLREVQLLKQTLHALLHHTEDQTLIVDLGPLDTGQGDGIESVGRAYQPEARARII